MHDWGGLVVPIFSYDSNLLFGYGAFGQVVHSDTTGEEPFLLSVSAQLMWTTGGYRSHFLRLDWPAAFGRLRFSTDLRRIVWSVAPYYGLGTSSPLVDDPPDGYYTYAQSRWAARNTLRVGISGPWEAFVTQYIAKETAEAAPGSLLALEAPDGLGGGRYAWVAVGAIYDTRTNEIDPDEGISADASIRIAAPIVGSDWTMMAANAAFRTWLPVGTRAVWASHLLFDARLGESPFFDMAYVGGQGRGILGGRWALRGLPEERYRADGVVLVQEELRIDALEFDVRGHPWTWMVVPFVDAARFIAWTPNEIPGPEIHPTGGVGTRLNVRDIIVVRLDVGVGLEEYTSAPHRRPCVQTYLLADHPF